MRRAELEKFILDNYNTKSDHPWIKYPNYTVFRHSNQKWFAVIMDISKNKLGLFGSDTIDVANFKCDPILLGSFLGEPGFFPAYHMNKERWITVLLDGSVADEKIKMLLHMSYEATAPKYSKKRK